MPQLIFDDSWRQTHLGRLLARALQRFDARVLQLMADDEELALGLSNLAARGSLSASQVQITRHLPQAGCSLTELAARAGVSKQAMGKLVDQCAAWDLVARTRHTHDARSIRIVFTAAGLQWLKAYSLAVQQAQAEFRASVGTEVATVVQLGLEAYVS